LKISEKTSIGKKSTKIKSKTPHAVCGEDFHRNLLRKQQEKEKMEMEKQKRREDREAKKATKKTKVNANKKRKSPDTNGDREREDSDLEDITYMETDSDEGDDSNEKCSACFGEDGLDDNAKWIGCNRCPRWFHKSCLSERVEQMTDEELEMYNFICQHCTKLLKTQKNKTTLANIVKKL